MTMRVYLDQIGCRLNYSEMETLAQRLVAVGHQLVDAPEDAQVIVFNSCAVTAGAERDSRKRVGQLHAPTRRHESPSPAAGRRDSRSRR